MQCVGSEKSRLCSVLALKSAHFSLARVQNDVLSPSRLHIIAFSIDQQLHQRDAASSRSCHGHVSCTHVPASVPNSTGFKSRLFGSHRSAEIKFQSLTVSRA